MMRPYLALVALMALTVLSACAPRAYMVGQVARIVDDGMAAFDADDDLDLLRNAFPADIKLLEALLVSSPDDRRLLALLSRLYASYAFAFLETDLDRSLLALEGCPPRHPSPAPSPPLLTRESVSRYYFKGLQYGLRALQTTHDGWQHEIGPPAELDRLLSELRPEDTPALFWYAFNLGAFIRLNTDSIRIVSKAHIVQSAMQRVITLKPSYYYGVAHLVLLAYNARPPAMGGNPAAARRQYDTFKATTGDDFLLADVYYARYYLQQKQDRSEFVKTLSAVLDHPKQPASYSLLNQVARVRARIYLDAVNCLFL